MSALSCSSKRLTAASRSPRIWAMGVSAAMIHFGLRNEQVHAAREAFLLAHGAEAVVKAQRSQRHDRLYQKVVNAERRYLGLTEQLQTSTLQAIGTQYNISRQRVHALLGNLMNLAKLRGTTPAAMARQVVAAASPGA